MKTCRYCGQQNEDDAKGCTGCGTDDFGPTPEEELRRADAPPACLRCQGARVTRGRIRGAAEDWRSPRFEPEGRRFLALTFGTGPKLSEEAYGCLDCGLVWSSVAPDKLSAFIRKHCSPKPGGQTA